jgi:hypothetical protein
MKHLLPLCCALLTSTALAETEPQSLLVLDASGSMWGQIDGRAKIEIAREAVGNMLSTWPASQQLGLMVYGHRRKGDCADIELLSQPQDLDVSAFNAKVAALQPKGMTPISASVREAAKALRSSEQAATVILISDGEETCNADPCAVGKELEDQGVSFTAHVIGFDLPAGPARAQLECLAKNTGGRYIAAQDAASLQSALSSLAKSPAPTPPAVKTGEAWIEGFSLTWAAGERLDANDEGATQVVEFSTEQSARDCQALCLQAEACAAWHYEPTGSYFIDFPRCFLKGKSASLLLEKQGEGFVAGIKPGVKVIRDNAN